MTRTAVCAEKYREAELLKLAQDARGTQMILSDHLTDEVTDSASTLGRPRCLPCCEIIVQ